VIEPRVLQIIFEVQPPAARLEEPKISLLRRRVLAHRQEVERHHVRVLLAKPHCRAVHEGGLAHLAGGEDVAELAAPESFVELRVWLALDIGGGVGAEGSSGDVEAALDDAHSRPPEPDCTGRRTGQGRCAAAGSRVVLVYAPLYSLHVIGKVLCKPFAVVALFQVALGIASDPLRVAVEKHDVAAFLMH
jgi:hypothetical protein